MILSQAHSQTNLVNNGSFEIIYGSLPHITGPNYYEQDFCGTLPSKTWDWAESYNYWVNISTGYCNDPSMDVDPAPNNCQSWYTPTLGSPEYYHEWVKFYYPDNLIPHVKVPDVKVHLYIRDGKEKIEDIVTNDKRYPFETSIYGSKNAFCGLLFNEYTYREYLQSQLVQPMLSGHCYHVSFRVSLSKSLGCSGYLKKLGAYFSNGPLINNQENTNQTDKYNHYLLHTGTTKQNNINFVHPQVESNKNLNQSADVNGLYGWDIVEGDVTVPDNVIWDHITIGNFEEILSFTRKSDPNPNLYYYQQSYYFIDSVNIIEKECDNSGCGHTGGGGATPPWKLDIKAQQGQTDCNTCCYQCTLKITPKTGICDINKLTISSWNGTNWVQVYNHNGYITPGPDFIFNFCILKTPEPTTKPILIEYNKGLTCYCTEQRDLTCNCDCSYPIFPLEDYMLYPKALNKHLIEISKIPYRNKNGQCCYDVFLNNNSECHYDFSTFKYLSFESTGGEQPIYSGVTFTQSAWTVRTDTYDGKTIKGFERPSSNTCIFPYSKIQIGTICITANSRFPWPFPWGFGARSFKIVLSSKFPNEGNFYDYSCTTDDIVLTCITWAPSSCSDFINADLNKTGFSPDFSHGCFYELRYQQVDNIDYNCDIYKIRVFDPYDSIIPAWTYTHDDTLYPIQPIYEWKPILLLAGNMPDMNGISVNVGFYGLNDTLLCMKHVEAYCDPGDTIISGGLGESIMPKLSYIISDNQLIYKPVIFPNPTDDEFTFKFALLDNGFIKIEIINALGELVQNVFEGELNKGKYYEYKINMSCCGNGNYFVRILNNNSVQVVPFILLK